MKSAFQQRYDELLASGRIEADTAQADAVALLDELAKALPAWEKTTNGWRAKFLPGMFGTPAQAPAGTYIHGKVGRGKTMLMDLFYDTAPVDKKRRLHFHQFMAEVHDMIADARRQHDGDPLPFVAEAIADEAPLLCFDEIHITDIADAMILGRLFQGLFSEGVVVVATSNAAPRELYKNGLNRPLFIPFIEAIEQHMTVVELAARKDYRLDKLAGRRRYFSPLDAAAHREMDRLWLELTGTARGEEVILHVKGRSLVIPQAAHGAARFTFDDLCVQPLGSLDYLSIARDFHTVFVDAVPVLGPAKRNEARRFINLIDTLYDNRISLIMSAEADADALYVSGDGSDLFQRTQSRLFEMRSDAYLAERERLRAEREKLPAAAGEDLWC